MRYPKTTAKDDASTLMPRKSPQSSFAQFLLVLVAWLGAAAPAAAVRIVVAGPLSGPNAPATQAMAQSARSGARLLPAAPSPVATAAEVSIVDDGCDAVQAEAAARKIVAAGADLVLGHPCPKAAMAAAKIYAAAGITFMATATRHAGLTAPRPGPSIFRFSGRDDAQGLDAARHLARSARGKPVAIVRDHTLYAQSIAAQTKDALEALGIATISATFASGDLEYPALIAKIKDAGAVFFAGFPMEAGLVLKDLRAAGSHAPFLATDTVASDVFTATYPELARSTYVLRAAPAAPGSLEMAAVLFYGETLRRTVGPFRDALGLKEAINANLGRSPTVRFDARGNAASPSFGLSRWDGSQWRPASMP